MRAPSSRSVSRRTPPMARCYRLPLGYAPRFKQFFHTRQTAGDVADFGRAAAMECTQRQLRPGLANRLCRDYAHGRADINHIAGAQGRGRSKARRRRESSHRSADCALQRPPTIELLDSRRDVFVDNFVAADNQRLGLRIDDVFSSAATPQFVLRRTARRCHPSGKSASRDWYCNPSG